MTQKLRDSIRGLNKQKSDKINLISGVLGITIGGQTVVEVPNRDGYVFVRLRGNMSELIQAYNGAVSPIYGLPILVTYENNRYAIYGRDTEKYGNWGESSYLPLHGEQHSFAPELGLGGDPVWVYSRQIVPLSSVPSGTLGAGNVIVNSHIYLDPIDASWKFLGDEGTPNVLGAKPTGTSARLMLLCWNVTTQDPVFLTGSFFPNTVTGTAAIVPYIPSLSNNRLIPISAIRLVSGTSSIGWENIYDLRQFAVSAPFPFIGGIMVQDEGVGVGTGSILNFVGDNVQASISGDTVRIYITGTPVQIQDESVNKGLVTTINFVGENVDASVAGSTARIFITGSIGATSQNIQDEGVPAGSVTTFNFVGPNVDASVSGSVVRVFVTGSSGGGGSLTVWDEGVSKGTATILNVVSPVADISISGSVARLFITGSTGGMTTGTVLAIGDATYLRLDAFNDPVHGALDVTGTFNVDGFASVVRPGENALYVEGNITVYASGTSTSHEVTNFNRGTVGAFYQYPQEDVTVSNSLLDLWRGVDANFAPDFTVPMIWGGTSYGSGTASGGFLRYDLNNEMRFSINPSMIGTGTAALFDTETTLDHQGKLLLLSNAGTPKFWVNASGTAFERGNQLAKESAANGTFTTVDSKTVTVRNGIIVSIV